MGEKEKVALIINTASYDRVSYALTVAGMSAALGKEVHVLFAYGALRRLVKGWTDVIDEETDAWIRDTVRDGLRKEGIEKISESLRNLKKFGGTVYACVAAMALHRVTRDELVEEVDQVMGIAGFLELAKDASSVLYI